MISSQLSTHRYAAGISVIAARSEMLVWLQIQTRVCAATRAKYSCQKINTSVKHGPAICSSMSQQVLLGMMMT
jgi:hypothetical protein